MWADGHATVIDFESWAARVKLEGIDNNIWFRILSFIWVSSVKKRLLISTTEQFKDKCKKEEPLSERSRSSLRPACLYVYLAP